MFVIDASRRKQSVVLMFFFVSVAQLLLRHRGSISIAKRKIGLQTILRQFPQYWYSTGPSILFDRCINVEGSEKSAAKATTQPRKFTLLINRKETITNPWHTLMEIFAMTITLDVLRTTLDPATSAPFLLESDAANTQVMIVDTHPDGSFYELWNLFAKQPIIRIDEVTTKDLESTNIIVPLPGGANTFWQGDWEMLDCGPSPLLSAFSKRVFNFYNIKHEAI